MVLSSVITFSVVFSG